MKNIFLIAVLSLTSLASQAQIQISPALVNNEVDMSNKNSIDLSLINSSGSSQSVILSVGSGFSILLNRCPSSLNRNKSCYIRIGVNPSLLSMGLNSVPLMNGSSSLGSLVYNKNANSEVKSILVSTSSLNFGTLTRSGNSVPKIISIQNTGNVPVQPIIEVSPNTKMVLNRCTTAVKPSQSCSVGVVYSAQTGMSNGSVPSESIIVKKDALDSGTPLLVSASLNVVLSCSGIQHQENGLCVSNSRSCSVANGTGKENWSLGSWSSCIPETCDSGFIASGNSCVAQNYDIFSGNFAASNVQGGGGYYDWQGTAYVGFTITQKTKLKEYRIRIRNFNGYGQVGFGIYSSVSPTMGLIGDSSHIGMTELRNPSSFPSGQVGQPYNVYESFLFNNGDVILNPGTYYLSFLVYWTDALQFTVFSDAGSPLFNTGWTIPHRLIGEVVP